MEKSSSSDSGNFGNALIRPRRLFQNLASPSRPISTISLFVELRWVHTTQDSFVWFEFKKSDSKKQGSRTSDWSSVGKLTLVIWSPRHTFTPVKKNITSQYHQYCIYCLKCAFNYFIIIWMINKMIKSIEKLMILNIYWNKLSILPYEHVTSRISIHIIQDIRSVFMHAIFQKSSSSVCAMVFTNNTIRNQYFGEVSFYFRSSSNCNTCSLQCEKGTMFFYYYLHIKSLLANLWCPKGLYARYLN